MRAATTGNLRQRARMLPPLNALRVFEAAARLGSFKEAALELSLSPPAVSRQILLLEEWLGNALFIRSNREVTLTLEGQLLMEEVTPALDRIALATSAMMRKRSTEMLVIDVPPTFAVRWLIPRLPPFVRQFPGVDIRLTTSTGPVDLSNGNADLAIRRTQEDDKRFESRAFLQERLLPVCSPAVLARQPLRELDDLAGHTLIHSETASSAWSDWLKAAGYDKPMPAQSLKFEAMNYAIEAALNGMGIAIIPAALVIDEVASGKLTFPFKSSASRRGDYRLLMMQGKRHQEATAAFWEWLIAEGRSCQALVNSLIA